MRTLYFFSHIPKAAGTTLIFLLRRHFGLRHLDVEHRADPDSIERTYRKRDFRIDRRLMPWSCSFAGHWLKPWAFSGGEGLECRWFAIFREPDARSLSQYWQDLKLGRLPSGTTFAEWSTMDYFGLRNRNAQCRQICGGEDAKAAIETIEKKDIFVGLLEDFDLTLKAWRVWTNIPRFDLRYQKPRNVRGSADSRESLFRDQPDLPSALAEHNREDHELFQEIRDQIFPRRVEECGGRERLEHSSLAPSDGKSGSAAKVLANRAFRNAVYKPAVFLDRTFGGRLSKSA